LNQYFKELYLSILLHDFAITSEKFAWAFPTTYYLSLYSPQDEPVIDFNEHGAVWVGASDQNPLKAFLLRPEGIIKLR